MRLVCQFSILIVSKARHLCHLFCHEVPELELFLEIFFTLQLFLLLSQDVEVKEATHAEEFKHTVLKKHFGSLRVSQALNRGELLSVFFVMIVKTEHVNKEILRLVQRQPALVSLVIFIKELIDILHALAAPRLARPPDSSLVVIENDGEKNVH